MRKCKKKYKGYIYKKNDDCENFYEYYFKSNQKMQIIYTRWWYKEAWTVLTVLSQMTM